MTGPLQSECARSACSQPAQKTYTGPNGNQLRVCRDCYATLVTRHPSLSGTTDPDVLDEVDTFTMKSRDNGSS